MKAPLFPFHTWSPDAYAEAPTAGSVVLAAVMAKLGTYGIIRFDLTLFPRAVVDLAPLLLTLGVDRDPLRGDRGVRAARPEAARGVLIARPPRFHRARHVRPHDPGALWRGPPDGQPRPRDGGALHPHRVDLRAPAAAGRPPSCAVCSDPHRCSPRSFTLAMMASLGLPGLNRFVGEFLILSGTFLTHRWWAVVATVGVVFSAIYLLWAYQQAFHHATRQGERAHARPELARRADRGAARSV